MKAKGSLQVSQITKSHSKTVGYFTTPEGKLKLTEDTAKLGIFPVRYLHGVENNESEHAHDFFEIFFVLKGKGFNRINKVNFPIAAEEIIFVENQKKHAILAVHEPLEILNICFLPSSIGLGSSVLENLRLMMLHDFLRPFKSISDQQTLIKLSPSTKTFSKLSFYANDLVELYEEGRETNAETLRHLLRLILFYLLREYRHQFGKAEVAQDTLHEAATWIKNHSSEKITLNKLAEGLGISRTYFSSRFNQNIGKNLNEYINEVRIQKASELLRSTELTVLEIALETGFDQVAHFHRTFKKLTSLTPQKWRALKKGP